MPKSLLTRPWALGALALILVALSAAALWRAAPDSDILLQRARVALKLGKYEEAERLAVQVRQGAPEYSESRLIAGEAATKRKRYEEALEHYLLVPEDGSETSVTAIYCAGDLLFQLDEVSRAEDCYRRVLEERPDDLFAHEQLGRLLGTFGRRWESIPHLFELVRRGQFTVEYLLLLGDGNSALAPPEDIERYRTRAPDDSLPLIALARKALERTADPLEAESLARQALARDASQLEAWAILGRALAEQDSAELDEWHAGLPWEAEVHPDIWLVRGILSQKQQQPRAAVRCFWEAVRRAPNHRAANYQLGRTLVEIGQAGDAAPFFDRAKRLRELEVALDLIYLSPFHQQQKTPDENTRRFIREAADLTHAMGRPWEAWGWSRLAITISPDLEWAQTRLVELTPQLKPELPQTLPEASPAHQVDYSAYPLPTSSREPRRSLATSGATSDGPPVRFADRASETGLEFQYFNGSEPAGAARRLPQVMGGGVAVLDFDGDHWPDLYFTQGGHWPARPDERYENRLFRNVNGRRFAEITAAAGVGDRGFGQGATVGDFNDDGFADAYVANVGPNRLYRNNGDGSFTDVTAESGIDGDRWTSSCLMADLNGDGWPDIYDVNYLAGEDALSLVCHTDGRSRTCGPAIFTAEQDRFLQSRGDGTFEEATAEAGFVAPDGKGLGILAADLRGTGRLDVFVANDTTANFYFVNETDPQGSWPKFRESAILSGLALDPNGLAQGSMGIAVDDANGDGRPDLFVSNFFEEPNALYLQSAAGLFEDASRRAGLHEPGYLMVGFGTQFLDAELDGLPDLIVTNGHISDYTDQGQLFEMPAQFFRNASGGRFIEAEASAVGPYFEGQYLGRGLARVDWNRDGREDCAVSHLDAPAGLLTNRSQPAGRFLALRFVGTRGSRDAIGTTVTVRVGDQTFVRQLTAGDGYMASNERRLVFGVGSRERIDQISIRWPSGLEEVFENISADRDLLAIEGNRRLAPVVWADRTNEVRLD